MTDPSRSVQTTRAQPNYMELGERLRQHGQLAAAAIVTSDGLAADPTAASGHDLLGRIRADQGDDAGARAAWSTALGCEPGHLGALKGLAFLAFRARDYATAERHLESAVHRAPHDASLLAALDRVRVGRPAAPSDDALGFDDPANGLLLADAEGMRLSGGLGHDAPGNAADAAAAEAGGLLREAGRTARLLGIGSVRHLVVESADARFAVVPVRPDAALLAYRTPSTPTGRLVATAQRAAQAAERWLAEMS